MMIDLLGFESDAGHESPCFAEIGEFEGAGDTRLIRVGFPFRQCGKEVGTFLRGEENWTGGRGHQPMGGGDRGAANHTYIVRIDRRRLTRSVAILRGVADRVEIGGKYFNGAKSLNMSKNTATFIFTLLESISSFLLTLRK
jgi:hypothetical protein